MITLVLVAACLIGCFVWTLHVMVAPRTPKWRALEDEEQVEAIRRDKR